MTTFQRIATDDDQAQLDELKARYQTLLTEALEIAQQRAISRPVLVREILASGSVEGLAKGLNARVAGVSFRAEKYQRTWHSLIPWQYLESATAADQAESMIETVEANVEMTEANSWPQLPCDQA